MTALDDHPGLGSDPTTVWSRLGIDPSRPRPAWAVLDAIRTFEFSGEATLHLQQARHVDTVRVYTSQGLIYWAERHGDSDIAERLVRVGALTRAEAACGTVRLGDVVHVGRLFQLLPGLDVDRILTAVEYLRDTVIAAVADSEVHHVDLADHRHHEGGMVLWELDVDEQEAPLPLPPPSSVGDAGRPTGR